jgi:NAD-dependent SIR2 family protein deacetylase
MIDEGELDIILKETARLIKNADAMAIFAGAGMSVDSGIPAYRGNDGLWTRSIQINNVTINNFDLMKPGAFKRQPELAWGFIGLLMEQYDKTSPHIGLRLLKEFVSQKEYFIVTSNIDGQFQKAGFSEKRIFEFHGSIFNTQCGSEIECGIWDTPTIKLSYDGISVESPTPVCPVCHSFCRPNIHLFDDDFFVPDISAEQQFRYMEWREKMVKNFRNIVALEIGAGKTIPTIRRYAENFAEDNFPLIRINPFDFKIDKANHISIPVGARDSLIRIKDYMDNRLTTCY